MIPPPVTKAFLLSWLSYSAWATTQVLETCTALHPEEMRRDMGISHSSILGTLRHMYYAERVWLKRLSANTMPVLREVGDQRLFQDMAPEPELADLQQRWPRVWEGLSAYCTELSDDELANEIVGPDWGMARWKVVVHAVNHSTIHRGQVVGLLRQMDRQPPGTDIFGFFFAGHA